ncbi:hypothetical protein [Nocardia thailandica]|uniref:Uncharacterized protein n=1 Tax=Nocardia thailandica TaxID=257275 RepID=A0ABW6PN26_9NOCA|nr:hypothetical protein [Nocardia thailandica]
MSGSVEVTVALSGAGLDAEQLDENTRRLRTELLGLDVEHVTAAAGPPAPEGTRGVDMAAIGQLVVGVGPGLVALRQLLETLRGWRSDRRGVGIVVQIGDDRIELDEASDDSERELVEAFVRRHAQVAES